MPESSSSDARRLHKCMSQSTPSDARRLHKCMSESSSSDARHLHKGMPESGSNDKKAHFITKTYVYNFDPVKPHFYIVKLSVYRGVHYFSYFC